jgi:YVTN family beta-propeller protein
MRFSILGPLEVFDDGHPVTFGAGRQRKLLAILLLHANEAVSTDRLIEELWNDHPPETAAKALQGHVSQLRKRLGADSVLTLPAGYVLKLDPAEVDAYCFERLLEEAGREPPEIASRKLRDALALWRGPPLADFAYDDFARNEINRLEELRLTSIEKRIDADLAVGRHVDVIAELEALVAAHPLRERFASQQMLALYRAGRQTEALEVYRDTRAALLEELGLEPGEELNALQKAILSHDDSLAAPLRIPMDEERTRATLARRPLRSPRAFAAVGVLLLAGAIAAAAVELTNRGGSTAVAVTANSVAAVDARSMRVVADIPLGSSPVAVAVGAGGVWVANANDGTVTRLDPTTRKVVATIGVGADVSDIAIGFGSVWIADGNDGSVTRIDPRLNVVQATLDLESRTQLTPTASFLIAVDKDHVWASRGGELLRIDPRTESVDRRINVGMPIGLATGGGAVWVTTLSERVLRIDAKTATVTAVTTLPTQAIAPVFTAQSLWVIVNLGHGEIERLDPNSLTPTATALVGGSPTSLASSADAVWVSLGDGTIARIDAASANVTSTVRVGQDPSSLATGGGVIWIAAAEPGTTS